MYCRSVAGGVNFVECSSGAWLQAVTGREKVEVKSTPDNEKATRGNPLDIQRQEEIYDCNTDYGHADKVENYPKASDLVAEMRF